MMDGNMDFQELQQIVSICLDEIVALKEENRTLQEQVKLLQEKTNMVIESERNVINRLSGVIECVDKNRRIANRVADNIKYEIQDPKPDNSDCFFPNILPIEDTLEQLIVGKKSMARYGDGEFAIMQGFARQKFQSYNEDLAKRLREIIRVKEDGFLVAIADNYGSLEQYNEDGKQGIRNYMTAETRRTHREFLDMSHVYHNAYISRPYVMYADNQTEAAGKRFQDLKKIWDGRSVIFVEGSQTRLGVRNDLFDNAAQIGRIVAPPEHSYSRYAEILEASLKFAKEDTLFLIALGPTAGVLAYDLFKSGYQAIDIGHLDLEYEWYLQGQGKRVEVKHKYNNELQGGYLVEDVVDEDYLQQIICRI